MSPNTSVSLLRPSGSYEPPDSQFDLLQQQPLSPYRSESAHVLSLQYPTTSSIAQYTTLSQNSTPSNPNMLSPPDRLQPSEVLVAKPPSISPSSKLNSVDLAKSLCIRAKRSFESRIRSISPRQVSGHGHFSCVFGSHIKKSRRGSPEPSPNGEARSSIGGTAEEAGCRSMSKSSNWFKDETRNLKIARKLFGKAPWHRKESSESFSTVTSSIREILRGVTPPATPLAEYTTTCKWHCGSGFRLTNIFAANKGYINWEYPGGVSPDLLRCLVPC